MICHIILYGHGLFVIKSCITIAHEVDHMFTHFFSVKIQLFFCIIYFISNWNTFLNNHFFLKKNPTLFLCKSLLYSNLTINSSSIVLLFYNAYIMQYNAYWCKILHIHQIYLISLPCQLPPTLQNIKCNFHIVSSSKIEKN